MRGSGLLRVTLPRMFDRILVLCTGNICRSPIAERLLQQHLNPRGRQVRSAGTAALVGHAAESTAIEVARTRGVDLTAHRARQATAAVLAEANLILVMDRSHQQWIDGHHPQFRGRVFRLTHWNGGKDVADPYLQARLAFEQAFDDIEAGVNAWVERV